MDYKKMLEDIDEIVGSDFTEDMCSKTSFTNEEACAMSEMIGRIYTVAHQIHCKRVLLAEVMKSLTRTEVRNDRH